jgi:exodeoxyribonuclease-3
MKKEFFRVATYNANGIRARLHIILPWLRENHVDCLCIQETKVRNEEFPEEPFQSLDMKVVFSGQKGYNGIALVSPHEITDVRAGFGLEPEEPEDTARLLSCRILDIDIVNTYVPQGRALDHPNFKKKLEWFSRLRELFQKRYKKSDRLIWCGDINVAPEPIDVYAPEKKLNHVCFHESVRQAFKECLEWGLSDCFRKVHPDEPNQYTFYDYRIPKALERRLGWRIDHILATRALCKDLEDCFIDLEPRKMQKPSDHTFLVADFRI